MANSYGHQCLWQYGDDTMAFVDIHACFSSSGHGHDLIIFRDPRGELVPMKRHIADRVVTPIQEVRVA